MTATELAARADRLRALHRPGRPLLLPNGWDAASARALAAAGCPAIATSSGAVAESLGFEDGERAPVDEMLAAAGRICHAVDVPVTVDTEAGYGLGASVLVARLLAAGAAGCNLEDSDHRTGDLRPTGIQAAWLAEVRAAAQAAGVGLVLNARVDVHLRQVGPPEGRLAEAVRRGRAYLEAGADCVYPIFVDDEPTIGGLVDGLEGRINILYRPGAPSPARLAALGVARISFGSGLHRATLALAGRMGARIAAGEDPYTS